MARVLTGNVVSLKMKDTAVVEVVWKRPHPLYRKLMQRSKKYKVALSDKTVVVGDTVKMTETKKMACGKYFVITEVLKGK